MKIINKASTTSEALFIILQLSSIRDDPKVFYKMIVKVL